MQRNEEYFYTLNNKFVLLVRYNHDKNNSCTVVTDFLRKFSVQKTAKNEKKLIRTSWHSSKILYYQCLPSIKQK